MGLCGQVLLTIQVLQQQGDCGFPTLAQCRVDVLMQNIQETQGGSPSAIAQIGTTGYSLQEVEGWHRWSQGRDRSPLPTEHYEGMSPSHYPCLLTKSRVVMA